MVSHYEVHGSWHAEAETAELGLCMTQFRLSFDLINWYVPSVGEFSASFRSASAGFAG